MPRPKWYFFWNVEQLDSLIAGLTSRGIREKELKHVLQEEKSGIAHLLQKCPVLKLNTEKTYPESVVHAAERKSQRGGQGASKHSLDPNLNFPLGTSIERILELQLRDLILETEDKIFLGALGSLKVVELNFIFLDLIEYPVSVSRGSDLAFYFVRLTTELHGERRLKKEVMTNRRPSFDGENPSP